MNSPCYINLIESLFQAATSAWSRGCATRSVWTTGQTSPPTPVTVPLVTPRTGQSVRLAQVTDTAILLVHLLTRFSTKTRLL